MFLRLFGYIFGIGAVLFLAIAAGLAWYISDISADVPSYEVLNNYEPPVMTRFHASDGQLIGEYARERRLYLPIEAIPERLKAAFLSAEDRNFYSHAGLDYYGIARAAFQNVQDLFTGGGSTLVGASTITQQVAKNFLLTADQTWDRKVMEAILAIRIEQAFTKDEILELYMNENNLGMGAYGVAAAALIYFNKSVQELTIAECAYIAALLKGPNNYHPFRNTAAAIERRNWVIDRMVENGYVTPAEATAAKAEPLGVVPQSERPRVFAADYFTSPYQSVIEGLYADTIAEMGGVPVSTADYFVEEVRRELLAMYGEDELYGGGLSVRTSLDPQLQVVARNTLMDALVAFDEPRGWHGTVATIEIGDDWGVALGNVTRLSDVFEWQLAVILEMTGEGARIGLQPARAPAGGFVEERVTGLIRPGDMSWAGSGAVSAGDVVFVEPLGEGNYRLRQTPALEGGLVAMNPHTGRVLAMVGGFSYSASQFNRATQAQRQPGSSFKPFVYAAALDNGYTPSSVVMDAPITIAQGDGSSWTPENYSQQFYGPSTLRTGIEQSRNVMTVRLAQDMGMPLVAEYAERFGIYDDLLPVLAMSLGSGETTLMRMVSAYSVLANGGRRVTPTLIDRVQDRYGNTIFQHEERTCDACRAVAWTGQDEPLIVDNRDQVLDPMTAYQITSMMEGVVQRGTATVVRAVNHPVAGKTGTTNDYHDAWFIGYSTDLVIGVYLGYDTPRSLGSGNTGGTLAAPIFADVMRVALANEPPMPFPVPPGMSLIPIDRTTGLRVAGGESGTILEAFKPGTSPPDNYAIIGNLDALGQPFVVGPEADRAVVQGLGGLF